MTETPEAQPIAPVEKIRSALTWYRVLAWMTGVWLIALCYELILKYVVKVENPPEWISHGARLGVFRLPAVHSQPRGEGALAHRQDHRDLLAGTIPLLGIIVEQVQTRELKERFNL